MGLVIKSFEPSSDAILIASGRAVKTMIGTWENLRTSLKTLKPVTTGMRISRTTTSGFDSRISLIPLSPLVAEITSVPCQF